MNFFVYETSRLCRYEPFLLLVLLMHFSWHSTTRSLTFLCDPEHANHLHSAPCALAASHHSQSRKCKYTPPTLGAEWHIPSLSGHVISESKRVYLIK